MKSTSQLRALLAGGPVLSVGCFDPLSARLAELAGFEAIHLSGMGLEVAGLGAPDMGLLTLTELASQAARMAYAVRVPILADVDTGFGGALNVRRTVHEMERAGVAGLHIEDQTFPKRCPLIAGRKVVGLREAIDRIKAAVDARRDPDFVIVARCDADVVSMAELVDRCNRYLEAGADMVMPMMLEVDGRAYYQIEPQKAMASLRSLCKSIKGKVMYMGSSPPLGHTVRDLQDAGFAFVFLATSAIAASANAMAAVFSDIRLTGSDANYFRANPGRYANRLNLMEDTFLQDYLDFARSHEAQDVEGPAADR